MKLVDDRTAVVLAEQRLLATRRKYRDDSQWLQRRVRKHRSAIIVGSGVAAGVMAGWLPVRAFIRTGLSFLSLGFALVRTPLAPIALGALFAARANADPADRDS